MGSESISERSDASDEITAIVRIAGIDPIPKGLGAPDEMNVTPAMRRAGAIILWEYRGEVESEVLAERVYWVMRTVRLRETQRPDNE